MEFNTEHRREIDGLRSLAVLPVLFYHAKLAPFSGGFVGVDIFFVISGFLISALIMNDLSQQRFSLMTFYERRARRILPALFFVMIVTVLLSLPWMLPNDLQDLMLSYLGVSTFSSNVLFWMQTGYFDAGVELKPMLHTWSLAVEEQFYVVFPLALLLIWRFGLTTTGTFIVFVCTISFVLTFYLHQSDSAANFYLLPTRAWELLLGALASMVYAQHRKMTQVMVINQWLSLLGIAMIMLSIFIFNDKTPFPGTATLLPTIGTCLILIFANKNTIVGRCLSLNIFVGLGLISYSTYLWHQPVMALARLNQIDGIRILWAIPFSIALAYFTWRYIETPFRNRAFLTQKSVLCIAVISSSIFALSGYAVYKSDGLVFRLSTQEQKIAQFTEYPSAQLYKQDQCFLQPGHEHSQFDYKCYENGGKQLIWGDSHAAALATGLKNAFGELSQLTSSACPPILSLEVANNNCDKINQHIFRTIRETQPNVVWLHADWISYANQIDNIGSTLNNIRLTSPNSKIFVVGGVAQWKPTLPHALLKSGKSLEVITTIETPLIPYIQKVDEKIENQTKTNGAEFISLVDILCAEQLCKASAIIHETIEPIAWDGAHLTEAGSNYVAVKIKSIQLAN